MVFGRSVEANPPINLQVVEMYERQALATSQAAKKAKSGVEDNFW
jgi:hypothetical protein